MDNLDHLKDCEAREWISRFKARANKNGVNEAKKWWSRVCHDIERIRGLEGLLDLKARMNQQRKKDG